MIYVSQEQLDQVEYLITQSIRGNHVLFEPKLIKAVFSKFSLAEDQELSESSAYEVEHHIERLIELPTLTEKREYLRKLDEETIERVILTYFNIVDNNLFEKVDTRH